MKLLKSIASYFDLYNKEVLEEAGKNDKPHNGWIAAQFIALYFGILSKSLLDYLAVGNQMRFSLVRLLVALIVATAIFPAVYKQALSEAGPGIVQLCVVFASGLGYKTLIDVKV
jgi:hypothetical protein